MRRQDNVGYFCREELLESIVALKEQDYDKYARKMKKYLKWELIRKQGKGMEQGYKIFL